MNSKTMLTILALFGSLLFFFVISNKSDVPEPSTIVYSKALREMTIDDIINESEIIVIGEVKSILPSQWQSPNGKDLKNATSHEIFEAGGLFTDTLFSVNQTLKGNIESPLVRVRSFVGETEQVRWVDDSEVIFEQRQTYLLFLTKNYGKTAHIEPGSYTPVNAYHGVYKIVDNKAISNGDEWIIDELLNYIRESPFSVLPVSNIPETPEAEAILQSIELAYDAEAEVAYTFETSKLSLFFINDPRFPLPSETLKFILDNVSDPTKESFGYLDYKETYFSWWQEGLSRVEELEEKARVESRSVTAEELNAFVASKWGKIPGRTDDPKRYTFLKYLSIEINNEVATVTLTDGFTTNELFLVLVDGSWYIAGCNNNNVSPVKDSC